VGPALAASDCDTTGAELGGAPEAAFALALLPPAPPDSFSITTGRRKSIGSSSSSSAQSRPFPRPSTCLDAPPVRLRASSAGGADAGAFHGFAGRAGPPSSGKSPPAARTTLAATALLAELAPHPPGAPPSRGAPTACGPTAGRTCPGYAPGAPTGMPAGTAMPGRAPEDIHELDAPAGTSEMLGSKPLFSLRRLGKLMGFGITSPDPGFFPSAFLPPASPARTPAATTAPARTAGGSAWAHSRRTTRRQSHLSSKPARGSTGRTGRGGYRGAWVFMKSAPEPRFRRPLACRSALPRCRAEDDSRSRLPAPGQQHGQMGRRPCSAAPHIAA